MNSYSLLLALILLLPISFINESDAQETKSMQIDKCVRLGMGFINGALITDESKSYVAGGTFHYKYCIKVGPSWGAGIGSGLNILSQESFIPFYLNIIGFLSSDPQSFFIDVSLGYSFGWSSRYEGYSNYNYKGGTLIIADVGKKITAIGQFSVYLTVSYQHQFARAVYQTTDEITIDERLNYPLLSLNIGILLEQK